MNKPYRFNYPVYTFLTDHKNKVTASNIANFLQDIAGRNAHELGWAVSDLHSGGKTWVLSRIYIELKELPKYREEVTVDTWPSGGERLFAYRDFVIRNDKDEVIGNARSAWVVMDLSTRRPEYVPDEVKAMKDKYPPSVIDIPKEKVLGAAENATKKDVRVRRSDLDVNRHVNNVKFIEWAMEAIDDSYYDNHSVRTLDVVFKSEVLHTDTIESLISIDGLKTHHTILKNGSPACFVRVEWIKD